MHFEKEVLDSLTYKFAQAAGERKAQGREIISLGLGEPDLKTPDYVVEATIKALNDGYTHYSPAQGLPELRELIAEDRNSDWSSTYTAADVMITPGIKAAVQFALAAILEPGDEVILLSPYYVSYPAMVKLAEPTAKIVNVCLNRDYSLDHEVLRDAFNAKTKAILLSSPNNPTGMILSEEEVALVCELANEFNAYVIADEVYDRLVFPGESHHSFGTHQEIRDHLVVCNGYSKSHAMTGWRLGNAIGPRDVILRMSKMGLHTVTNTCTFIQKGACSIYQHEWDHLPPYATELKRRITWFHAQVENLSYMSGIMPRGGFFYFADISSVGVDSNSFCADLLTQTGIATTPGIAFGPEWDDHVRFSLATPMETIERAVGLMHDYRYETGK